MGYPRRKKTVFLTLLFFPLFLWPFTTAPTKDSADPWKALGVERLGDVDPPPFTLDDSDGKTVSLGDFKGKVVLLNFWATWCAPCREEMPAFEKLHKRFAGEGLAIVCIADYEPREKVLKYLREHEFTYKILIDEPGKVSEAYKAIVLPTTFIIDREGRAIGRAVGARDWAGVNAVKLLDEVLER
jgi:peroxiredoxin